MSERLRGSASSGPASSEPPTDTSSDAGTGVSESAHRPHELGEESAESQNWPFSSFDGRRVWFTRAHLQYQVLTSSFEPVLELEKDVSWS